MQRSQPHSGGASLGPPVGGMDRVVEHQLRQWDLSRGRRQEASESKSPVRPFVTISNAVGAGGRELAEALAERLDWAVFDKNLLTAMAEGDEWRAWVYRSLDERAMGWVEETARALMDRSFVRNDYFRRLTETVLGLARQGSAIFVGRFADLILPRGQGLRVKITASRDASVAALAQHEGVGLQEAERAIERIERERQQFLERHFPKSDGNRGRFDLVVNSGSFSPAEAIELILKAMRYRGVCPSA